MSAIHSLECNDTKRQLICNRTDPAWLNTILTVSEDGIIFIEFSSIHENRNSKTQKCKPHPTDDTGSFTTDSDGVRILH